MKTSEISFVSIAEVFSLSSYRRVRQYSVLASEVIGRLAASILLSPAAALDIIFHSLLVLPTFIYAIGKSIYQRQAEFTLPWQHLQRIRNAVAPLLLGSAFGSFHLFAGLLMSEPTDKHAVIGMLSSNTGLDLETPCSPIHSLSIITGIAEEHRYAESDDGQRKEIFSKEHIQALKGARDLERALEQLQAQEFIYKITNTTLFVMARIKIAIEGSCLSSLNKAILTPCVSFSFGKTHT